MKAAALVLLVLFLSSSALPVCSVPRPRLVCAEYSNSEMVVQATLLHRKVVRDKHDPQGILAYIYIMKTERAFKGTPAATFDIFEGNDSGRATFDWKKGTSYLLFLSYDKSEKAWTLDGCGNSGPIARAAKALEQIETMKAGKDGTIRGVISMPALSKPLSGISVQVRGEGLTLHTVTDTKGAFRFNVPAGHYVVTAKQKGHVFEPADLTYEDPRNLLIENGGCAQVQLARTD